MKDSSHKFSITTSNKLKTIKLKKAITLILIFFIVISFQKVSAQDSSYFFYKSSMKDTYKGWVVLLPGASGLIIFEDSSFYNRQAATLAQRGYDVLVVDYKAFYKASTDITKPKGQTGERICWVIEKIIHLIKSEQNISPDANGHIVGWSLAGEGIFNLLKDTAFIESNNIKSVALYYPTNFDNIEITSSIPVLIQTGGLDDIVDAKELQTYIKTFDPVKFIVYPNCHHGFDIESLTEPKEILFPPVNGTKHIFLYDKEASDKSRIELNKFLDN